MVALSAAPASATVASRAKGKRRLLLAPKNFLAAVRRRCGGRCKKVQIPSAEGRGKGRCSEFVLFLESVKRQAEMRHAG